MITATTYAIFFCNGAFLGAVLLSLALDRKMAMNVGAIFGLASLWFYHQGITSENLDGTFTWWGMNLDATGLVIVYFGPFLVFGLIFFFRFREILMKPSDANHT